MSNEGDRASVFRTTKVRTKLRGDGSWLQHRDEPEPEPQEEEKPWLEEVRARRLNGAPIETSPVSSPVKSTPPPVTSDTESKPATPGYLIRGVFTKLEARPSSPSSPYNGSSKPTVFTKKPSEAYKKIAPHIVRNTSESPEGQLSPEEQEKRTMVATSVLKTKSARRSYVLSAAKIYDSKETPSDTSLVSSNPSFVAKRVEIADDGEIAVTPTPASTVAPSPAVPPASAAPAPAAGPRTEVNTTAEPVKEEPLPQSVAAKEQLQDEKTKSNDPTVTGSVKVAPTEPQLQAETPVVKLLPPSKTSPAQKSAGSESPAPAYTVPRPVPAPHLAPFTATPYSRTPVPTKTLREITVKTEPEPEPQHEAEAAPEEEAESGPQPTEEQEPVLQDEAESEPEPEPTEEQEPELEDEAESEPEPTEEQEPELEDEAESETEPTEEQEPELEAESESTKEQEPELEDDSDSDSEIKAESLLPLGCPVIDPPQRVIKVVPHPVADVIPYTDSYVSEESELAEEEGGSAESPTPEDSVEEEPAPALEDGEPTTGDLLGFSDGPEEEPAEPVPPSPGRWSQDLLSGLGSESSPAKTSGTLDLLAHDVVVANTEARSLSMQQQEEEKQTDETAVETQSHEDKADPSSADPFDPYPIGSASHNSPSDLLEPVADVSINSSTTLEEEEEQEEEEEKSLDSEVNSPSSDLSSRPWTVTWEVPQLTNTEESQEAETEDQAADQRTVIMFEKKSTESSSPWDRWTSPTVYTVSTTTKEGDEEEEEEKVEEEESPEDTEKVTVITTVREVLNEPEPAVDRLASYSSAVVEEERRVPTPEPETKKPFVYVKEYVNAAEMSSLNPRDTFHRSDDFASSYSYSYNSPSSYIRVTESSSCTYCGKQVGNNAKITIEHLNIDCHPECFKCDTCSRPMGDLLHNMFLHNKKVHCESCYAAVI